MATISMYRVTRSIHRLLALGGIALLAGCDNLDAPDQNASTLEELTGSAPTRAVVGAAAQGLLAGMRTAGPCTGNCAYLGREGFNLDPSNPQNVQSLFINGGDFAAWANPYTNNKLADLVIRAVDNVPDMTAAERDAIRGLAKTVKAVDLMYVILTTDQTGAVLEVPADPRDELAPLASRSEVYSHIRTLLDEAAVHLAAAGTSAFPMTFPAGFNGFTTPATFAQFNRAIRARVNVYSNNYGEALTDLTGSFLNAAPTTLAHLNVGVYNTHSTTSGDATNGVYDATDRQRFAHTSLALDAVQRTPGDTTTRDDRFLRKVRPVRPSALQRYGFNIDWAFQVYNSLSDPVPVIRNEELILLRAEARLACTGTAPSAGCSTNPADRAAALADINSIRTVSGGLAPLGADPGTGGTGTGDLLLDELLYNKRYSLLWEGGYRWYDARHYGILAQLPHDQSGHVVFPHARLPDNECNARGIAIRAAGSGGPCSIPAGL